MDSTTQYTTPTPQFTTAEKTKNDLYEAYIASKKALIDVKDLTFEKIVELEREIVDITKSGATTLKNSAWTTYEDAKVKFNELGKATLDTATRNYESAKQSLTVASKNVGDHVRTYKDKAIEMGSDTYHSALEKLETARTEAEIRFYSARDTLSRLYEDAHNEAVKDYHKAGEYFQLASEKLKKFSDDAKAKTQENFEATKNQLEIARNKAQETLEQSKEKADELKIKLSEYNQIGYKHLEENYEAMKIRANDAFEALGRFKDSAKEFSGEAFDGALLRLQKAADMAAQNLKSAEVKLQETRDKMAQETVRVEQETKESK